MSVTKEQFTAFLDHEFPGHSYIIDELGDMGAKVTCVTSKRDIRPGNSISGPTMMTLADTVLYAAILGEVGMVALAVTTNLSFNFMRKPPAGHNIYAVCKLLKLGKTSAVGEVSIYSEAFAEPVCHAVGTYAIPQGSSK